MRLARDFASHGGDEVGGLKAAKPHVSGGGYELLVPYSFQQGKLMPHKTSAIKSRPEYLTIRSFLTLFSFPSEKIECQLPTGDDQNRDDFESATYIKAERKCPWGIFEYSSLVIPEDIFVQLREIARREL